MGLTAETIVASPEGKPGAGWGATQVMLRGAEVALAEVEAVLEDLPGVEQAVALVQEDPTGVQRLIAYVTPSSLSSTALMSGLRGKLPARMMPSSITPLAEVMDSSHEQPCSQSM